MGDESVADEGAEARGLSRRAALKAGVAAGVGVAAWSGASITSLGGTPAYAQAGCTGVIKLDLSGGCQNTDKSSGCSPGGEFRYHTLNDPPGGDFNLLNNPGQGDCCQAVAANKPVLVWTVPNLTCTTHVELWDGGLDKCRDKTGTLLASDTETVVGGAGGGQATIEMSCFQFTNGNGLPGGDTFWTVYANCASNGAPSGCL